MVISAFSILLATAFGLALVEMPDFGTNETESEETDETPETPEVSEPLDPVDPVDPVETSQDDEIFLDAQTYTLIADANVILDGGAGNDTLSGDVGNTDRITFLGGTGDDVLDAALMNNIGLFGEEGDDLLITSSHSPSGTGFTVDADGGDGNDWLIHIAPPQVWNANVPSLTGGAGQDVFEIRFDESHEVGLDDTGQAYSA